MEEQLPAVEVIIIRRTTFRYDLLAADFYRHDGDCKWVPEAEWEAGDMERGGESAHAEDIAANIFKGLLGEAITEWCTDCACPSITVDMSRCPHPEEKIEAMVVAMVRYLVAGRPVYAKGDVKIVNVGNEVFYDPKQVNPDYHPPRAVREALGLRVPKKRPRA